LAQGGGGIEVYATDWLNALIDLFGVSQVKVFTKNDTTQQLQTKWGGSVSARGSRRVNSRLRTPAFVALIFSAALRDRPDLIVSMHVNFSPAALWLKRMIGSRYLLTLHGIDVWGLEHKQRKNGIAKAGLIVPISGYTAKRVIQEQGISPERLRILGCVVDAEQFQIGPKPDYLLKRYNLSPGQPVILTVGRLSTAERYKGHDRVLRAIAEQSRKSKVESRNSDASDLQSPISDLRYLIVGDGNDRPRLDKLAEELGVREIVTFAGKVPAEELCDHYNLCDVFAMPSTGEGFGIVFLEALACGKPVLAGNRDASADALLQGELGVLVDPDNPNELRDAIVSILQRKHPHPLIYHPEALRQKVIESFGYEKFKERLAAILGPLLNEKVERLK
jgi:glycosyltransferase involved in cell wall biosynthesis